jgi:transposase InsO family protein
VRSARAGERDSKKGCEALPISERHALIAAAKAEHPEANVERLCACLDVSRSWFYDALSVPLRPDPDVGLRDEIERIVLENMGYGYRRVTAELHRRGIAANHKRVHRVMAEELLLCRLKKRFVVTTDSAHAHRTYPNLLRDMTLTGVNQAWVADITYIRLPRRFCYLAAILDAFSRRCIGWKLSLQIDARLVLAALDMAIAARSPQPGLVHHSDRGVQYACGEYGARLARAELQRSMCSRGTPYDNARAESFFKTLKTEEVYVQEYADYADAVRSVNHFIDIVYNRRRLHSSLGYRPPVEFEQQPDREDATAEHFNHRSPL